MRLRKLHSMLVATVAITTVLVAHRIEVQAVPLDGASTANATIEDGTDLEKVLTTNGGDKSPETQPQNQTDLDNLQTSASELSSSIQLPDPIASSASSYDPSIYSGLLNTDAFQQYVSQYGGAYAPAYAGYPAPVGYAPPAPPIYPGGSPYVVQTGYEGYLMPTTAATSSDSTTAAAAGTTVTGSSEGSSASLTIGGPFALLSQLFPMLMTTTLFRIIQAIVSAIGMILAGGLLTTLICNLTPLCDITFRTVTYLKRRAASDGVQRLIADEVTPERVRRTTEFVRNAIRKYRELQKMAGEPQQ